MIKYSNSLGRLHLQDQVEVLKKHTQFYTYEDYLHQHINNRTKKRSRRPPAYRPIATNINRQHTNITSNPTSTTIQYYPIQRTIIDYQEKKIKQLTPKKKIITEYVQKKHVEMVPKEVIVKDYYAVEYLRGYIREVVPEVKVEYNSVKKVIKKQEVIPHQKQIIYYPPHLTNLDDIKREAQNHLSKNGVIITIDAEYRPAITAFSTPNVTSSLIPSQKQKANNAMLPQPHSQPLSSSLTKSNYYRLPRPNKTHLEAFRSLGKNIKYGSTNYKQDLESESATQEGRSHHATDYSFAEREGSLKMNSSFLKTYDHYPK